MKIKIWLIALMLALTALVRGATNDLTGLLQQGLFEEEANRNLDAAITNYQSLASAFDKDRQLAATAIFRLGECYRKLGKNTEAVAQYQRIIKEFGDQPTLVTLSRQNLAGLNTVPKPPESSESHTSSLDAEANAASLEAQLQEIDNMSRDVRRVFVQQNYPNPVLTEAMTQLVNAEQDIIKLKLDYTPDHPKMKNAQELVDDLNRKVDEQVNGVVRSLEVKLEQIQLGLQQKRQSELIQTTGGGETSARQIEAAGKKLVADQAQLEQLLRTYLPSNPQVVELQRKIEFETASLKNLSGQIQNGQAPNTSPESAPITDEEQTQIRNIQAMIQNSPDLINAPAHGPLGERTPLQQAAEKGQLVVAKYLLDHGALVNTASSGNVGDAATGTPLFLAANNGHKTMVELLLARGAEVNGLLNPLYTAISHGFTGVAEVLIANKADVNAMNYENRRPLYAAISNDKTNLIQSLIEHGADVNAKDLSARTPLQEAAGMYKLNAVKILMQAGADVNARDKDGNTPLHNACAAGSEKIASLLLDSGASVDATNQNFTTPLMFACARGHEDVVRVLLAHKANPNLISRPDQYSSMAPPIFQATAKGRTAILQMLLEAGANPNGDTNLQWRPIFGVLDKDHLEALKLLLQHGANPNPKNNDGLTPLFLTTDPEVVHLLIDYKADLNARDAHGETPIMRVTGNAATNFTKILLDAGAKTDLQDTNGNTALHFAAYRVDPESVAALLEHKASPNIQNKEGYTPLDIIKAGNAIRPSMLALESRQALPIVGPVSFPSGNFFTTDRTLSDLEQKVVDLLVNAGGLANLPKRDRIEVRRGANTKLVIHKDSQGRNRYSLFEVIASSYRFLAQQVVGPWPQYNTVPSEIFGNDLPFPDFKKVVIYRTTGNPPKQTSISVDLENVLNTADCSRDRTLEWGDVVEIPEADHPVDYRWQGLSDKVITTLTNCVSREVTVKINHETIKLKLAPEFTGPPYIKLTGASFKLRSVLDNSGLIRVSSDLSRVKVIRMDPETKKPQAWVIDCTSEEQADLWLRDGDVIDVPEK